MGSENKIALCFRINHPVRGIHGDVLRRRNVFAVTVVRRDGGKYGTPSGGDDEK